VASNPGALNAHDIEDLFDGNICRCTGYRPILDAFKSFADDASLELKERLSKLPSSAQEQCPITQRACVGHGHCGSASSQHEHKSLSRAQLGPHLRRIGSQSLPEGNWLFPHSLDELMNIFKLLPDDNHYRLVAGNTGTGMHVKCKFTDIHTH